jgi:hypothetical protein
LKYYDEYTTPRSKEDVQNIINLFKDRIKLKTE